MPPCSCCDFTSVIIGTAFDCGQRRSGRERLGPEPLLIGETVYFSPIVKTTPIEARMLFWFELFPVK
jgi:hypothetical protein